MVKGTNIYLKLLAQTLKKNIRDTVAWLNSGEYIKFQMQRQDRLTTFFDESNLKEHLLRNGETCYRNSEDLIADIYQRGAKAGYREIREDRVFTSRDRKALNSLLNYNFDLITSLNDDHINNIRDALVIGNIEGKNPVEVAKDIRESTELPSISGLSPKARSIMIARTESSRALNEGALNAYRNYGIDQVRWITADDSTFDGVCEDCIEMYENNPHNIDDVEIPMHPNCRCTIAAYIPTN